MGCGAIVGEGKDWHRQYHLTANVVPPKDNPNDPEPTVFREVYPVWSIAVTHNQAQLASATGNNVISLWCLKEKFHLVSLVGHSDTIWKIAYSPDDTCLASTSADGTVRLWEVETGLLISILPRMHANWVKSLVWSPDGNRLATGGTDTRILIWNTRSVVDRCRRVSHYRAEAQSKDPRKRMYAEKQFKEAPSEKRLEFDLTQPICWWNAHEKTVNDMCFCQQDPRMLVSSGAEGTIAVWNVQDGSLDCRINGHIGQITCVAISPAQDELLASGGEDHTVRLWDLGDLQPGKEDTMASREKPHGHALAHYTLKGHEGGIQCVRFIGDGRLLASASKDCEIRIWNPDLKKGPTLSHKIACAHEAWVSEICWGSDQKEFFSASTDGLIFSWGVPKKYHTKHKKGKKSSFSETDHAIETAGDVALDVLAP
jgi:WD40 repeat protein